MLTELKVNYDQKNSIVAAFIISPLMILAYVFLLSQLDSIDNVLVFIIKCGLIFLIALFSICSLYGLFTIGSNQTALVLNKDGVWFDRFGFVTWDNIDTVFLYRIPTAPMETLAIQFKDRSIVGKQATTAGKMVLFWSKLFGYPITIANLDTDNQTIITYAKHFMHST